MWAPLIFFRLDNKMDFFGHLAFLEGSKLKKKELRGSLIFLLEDDDEADAVALVVSFLTPNNIRVDLLYCEVVNSYSNTQ